MFDFYPPCTVTPSCLSAMATHNLVTACQLKGTPLHAVCTQCKMFVLLEAPGLGQGTDQHHRYWAYASG